MCVASVHPPLPPHFVSSESKQYVWYVVELFALGSAAVVLIYLTPSVLSLASYIVFASAAGLSDSPGAPKLIFLKAELLCS